MLSNIVRQVLITETNTTQSDRSPDKLKSEKEGNKIAPGAQVDPGVFVKSSAIGFNGSRTDTVPTKITGDSAISDSTVNESQIANSLIDRSNVSQSSVSKCEIAESSVSEAASLSDCKVKKSRIRAASATYSYFEGTRVEGRNVINTSKLVDSVIFQDNKIHGCALIKVKASNVTLIGVNAEDLEIGAIQDDQGSMSSPTIKAVSGKRIEIGYAKIYGPVQIYSVKGKSPSIIGFPEQKARVSDNAKVYENAYVSGVVEGNAVVFGDAKIEGQATIGGDCKVGGTAVMVEGTFTTGEYMSGKHTGGDASTMMGKVSAATRSLTSLF